MQSTRGEALRVVGGWLRVLAGLEDTRQLEWARWEDAALLGGWQMCSLTTSGEVRTPQGVWVWNGQDVEGEGAAARNWWAKAHLAVWRERAGLAHGWTQMKGFVQQAAVMMLRLVPMMLCLQG